MIAYGAIEIGTKKSLVNIGQNRNTMNFYAEMFSNTEVAAYVTCYTNRTNLVLIDIFEYDSKRFEQNKIFVNAYDPEFLRVANYGSAIRHNYHPQKIINIASIIVEPYMKDDISWSDFYKLVKEKKVTTSNDARFRAIYGIMVGCFLNNDIIALEQYLGLLLLITSETEENALGIILNAFSRC